MVLRVETTKNAEHWRIDVFELWCWKTLLRIPWIARSNQSILKEISPEYSLEGLMLKLKLQMLWPRDAKSWLTGKDPDAGRDWGQEEKGMTEDEMVWWHHQLDGHELWASSRRWWRMGKPGMLHCMGSKAMGCKESDWLTKQQGYHLTLNII